MLQNMDATDRRIVEALSRDARTTQLEIAKAVGLSQPSVAERIRKLEERGIITGYVATTDAKKLGKDITAFIGVAITHPRYFAEFARRVLSLGDVLECHRVAGEDSYLLKVLTDNTDALDRLLVEGIRTIPGVARTHTTLVLASIKQTTEVSPQSPPPKERKR